MIHEELIKALSELGCEYKKLSQEYEFQVVFNSHYGMEVVASFYCGPLPSFIDIGQGNAINKEWKYLWNVTQIGGNIGKALQLIGETYPKALYKVVSWRIKKPHYRVYIEQRMILINQANRTVINTYQIYSYDMPNNIIPYFQDRVISDSPKGFIVASKIPRKEFVVIYAITLEDCKDLVKRFYKKIKGDYERYPKLRKQMPNVIKKYHNAIEEIEEYEKHYNI